MPWNINRILLGLVILAILFSLSACEDNVTMPVETRPPFQPLDSYQQIAGITRGEIAAIEKLKAERSSFSYGMCYGTEAFPVEDGYGGFAARFTKRLSELLGIPFELQLYEWGELIKNLDNHSLDFSGEISLIQNQGGRYYMTSEIAPRLMKVVRKKGRTIGDPPLYGMLRNADFEKLIIPYLEKDAEIVYVENESEAQELLLEGLIDLYIEDETIITMFHNSNTLEVSTLYPLIQSPVCFTTANPDLAPIISVIQKYLKQGADSLLGEMWRQGRQDYQRWRFLKGLNPGEQSLIDRYIQSGEPLVAALERNNYPVSFYDENQECLRGIIPDLFEEIEKLTGLRFQILPVEDPKIAEAMLESGAVSLIAATTLDRKWKSSFVWLEAPYMDDYFVLLSILEYPDIDESTIFSDKIGLIVPSISSTVFHEVFPYYHGAKEYPDILEASKALSKGEINLLMAQRYDLVRLYEHYQNPYFKSNYIFNLYRHVGFGFRKDSADLVSIINKLEGVINTDRITRYWVRRIFNYRDRLAHDKRFYIFIVWALISLVAITFLSLQGRIKRKDLERIVHKRTRELEVQTKLAKAASHAKSQFLASMSHEIRTPMNAIIGMSNLMRTDNLDEQQLNYFSDIKRMAKSLLQIINDILDISKIEAGKLTLVPVHYNISGLYADICSLGSYGAKVNDLEFQGAYDKNMPPILYGDQGRIRQIITNLISNAIKYTKQGQVRFSIERKEREGKTWIGLSVADTGIGIKKEKFSKVFQNFEQFDKERNYGITGTGLGLSITKNLVEMMGGTISFESEYEKGSVFMVYLPLVEGDPAQVQQVGAVGRVSAKEDLRILVVDDNSINLSVALGFLATHQIKAETVTSGKDAIEKLRESRYDLVFMDHMMPEMDGVEATQIIRNLDDPWLKEMPIIALSANAMVEAREEFIAAGMNDFIAKPIVAEELNGILRKWLPPDKITTIGEETGEEKTKAPPGQGKEAVLLEELAAIEGFDTKSGLFYVGDNGAAYIGILRQFCREFEGYMADIQQQLTAENWKNYTIRLHAMKGVLRTIGMEDLSQWAYKLEMAGREGDGETCRNETAGICAAMRSFKEQLEKTSLMVKEAAGPKTHIEAGELKQKLGELKNACAGGDCAPADQLAAELKTLNFNDETAEALDEICSLAEALDYSIAIKKIEALLERLG